MQGSPGENLEDGKGVCCVKTASPALLGFSWHKEAQLQLVTRTLWNFGNIHVEIVKLPCLQAQTNQVAEEKFPYPWEVGILTVSSSLKGLGG